MRAVTISRDTSIPQKNIYEETCDRSEIIIPGIYSFRNRRVMDNVLVIDEPDKPLPLLMGHIRIGEDPWHRIVLKSEDVESRNVFDGCFLALVDDIVSYDSPAETNILVLGEAKILACCTRSSSSVYAKSVSTILVTIPNLSEVIYFSLDQDSDQMHTHIRICRTSVRVKRNEIKVFKHISSSLLDEEMGSSSAWVLREKELIRIADKENLIRWSE